MRNVSGFTISHKNALTTKAGASGSAKKRLDETAFEFLLGMQVNLITPDRRLARDEHGADWYVDIPRDFRRFSRFFPIVSNVYKY